MNRKYEILADVGIDLDEMMENMGYDENVLFNVLKAFLEDKNYEKLCKYMKKHEYEEAFLAAHTLKGVFLNLGMKSLQNICSVIVEKLRSKDYDNIDFEFEKFSKMYNEIRGAVMEVYYE